MAVPENVGNSDNGTPAILRSGQEELILVHDMRQVREALRRLVLPDDTQFPSTIAPGIRRAVTLHQGPEDLYGHTPFTNLNEPDATVLPKGSFLRISPLRETLEPVTPGRLWKTLKGDSHAEDCPGVEKPLTPDDLNRVLLPFEPFTLDHQVRLEFQEGRWRTVVLPEGQSPHSGWELGRHYAGGAITGMRGNRFQDGIFLFRPNEHMNRFERDMARMRFPGANREVLEPALAIFLEANARWIPSTDGVNYFYVRLVGSPSTSGIRITGPEREILFKGSPVGPYMPPLVKAAVAPGVRPVPQGLGDVKSTLNYEGPAQVLLKHAPKGTREMLFHNEIGVQEGLSANVAAVYYLPGGERLVVFPENRDLLPGIMSRSAEALLNSQRGFRTERRPLPLQEAVQANELHFLGTAALVTEAMELRAQAQFDKTGQLTQEGEVIFKRDRVGYGEVGQWLYDQFRLILRRSDQTLEVARSWMQQVV